MGASEIVYVSHKEEPKAVSYEEVYRYHTDCEIIFNTSPVGMYPKNDGIPLDLSKFDRLEGVLDVVYNPIRTNLVQKAKELGKKAEGGLYMLGAQAVYASGHFFGTDFDTSVFERVYSAVLRGKNNITLIGMPCSGKTTVGKLLAEKTGKDFVDTDEEIVKEIGMSIPEYFAKEGEKAFRLVESQVIERVSTQNNKIIATGGGAVLNPDNIRRLKQNGKVYFLDRDLDMLVPTSDRPLSSNRADLEKRYNERYEIYKASCDVAVNSNPSAYDVMEEIYKDYIK
jgi:shikimate dehydrogenase